MIEVKFLYLKENYVICMTELNIILVKVESVRILFCTFKTFDLLYFSLLKNGKKKTQKRWITVISKSSLCKSGE